MSGQGDAVATQTTRRDRGNGAGGGGARGPRSGRRSTGDPGAGRERTKPKAERRANKREVPPEWATEIVRHWAELDWLDLEWQRGTAAYRPIQAGQIVLGDLADGKPRTDLAGDELRAEARALAELAWSIALEQAEREGEISARLTGYHIEKDGTDRELFSVARRCSTEEEPVGGDGSPESELTTWARNANDYTKGLQGHSLGLLKGVADPLGKVGELQTGVLGMLGRVLSEREALLRERWEREQSKLGLERTKLRLDAAEKLGNKALDLIGGELGAAVLDLLERGLGLQQVMCLQEACAELHVTFPAAALFLLKDLGEKAGDEEVGRDLLSALNVGRQARTEEEAAFALAAVWPRFAKFWPALRGYVTRRQLVLVAYIRGRMVLEQEAAGARSG